jgi:hypothetical protein
MQQAAQAMQDVTRAVLFPLTVSTASMPALFKALACWASRVAVPPWSEPRGSLHCLLAKEHDAVCNSSRDSDLRRAMSLLQVAEPWA